MTDIACVDWCFAGPQVVQAGSFRVHCSSECPTFTIISVSHVYSHTRCDTIAQGQDPVNFDIEDFDPVEIRASATTVDDFIAGMRKQNRAVKGKR